MSDDKLTKIHQILSRGDAAARVAFDGMPTVLDATTTTTSTAVASTTAAVDAASASFECYGSPIDQATGRLVPRVGSPVASDDLARELQAAEAVEALVQSRQRRT